MALSILGAPALNAALLGYFMVATPSALIGRATGAITVFATGKATGYSRDTIAPGDQNRYFGTWCRVTRTNAKSVSIVDAYGHRGTVPYTHIREHRPAREGGAQ